MSRTFTKLFSSITESTVWCEPDRTRLAWICMLAMADRNGRVWGSIPGLANRARIPVEDARVAIATFLAPDMDSRTADHEGRRIEPIDGGWRLLNHEKYRDIRDDESSLQAKRKYINARRARERESGPLAFQVANPSAQDIYMCSTTSTVDLCRDNAEAEAEAIKEISPSDLCADEGFQAFWSKWPSTDRKQDRKKCLAKWKKLRLDAKAQEIISHVEALKKSKKWLDGFEPAPLTYLNGERWMDGCDEPARNPEFEGGI